MRIFIAGVCGSVAAILVYAALMSQKPLEVVCDHPEWKETGYAVVSATCKLGDQDIIVSILD